MRPIGSEKIQDIDKRLARMREIAGIKESVTSKSEGNDSTKEDTASTIMHEATASNGSEYAIIKEENFVYIKKKVNENYEYMSGIQNLREFSYNTTADALKHLNLMFKEINEMNGHKENVDILKKKV